MIVKSVFSFNVLLSQVMQALIYEDKKSRSFYEGTAEYDLLYLYIVPPYALLRMTIMPIRTTMLFTAFITITNVEIIFQ
jgi:hypothetical protein